MTALSTEFGSRLVSLCDGRAGLRRGLQVEVLTPSESAPVIDFIASSETLDRYDEIIAADGWRLENYRRNPVFQNAHQYGDIIFTLGKALITEVRSLGGRQVLYQRVEFATDVNPMARIAYGLYRGKFLNAVSVGFIPLRWENGESKARGDGFRRKYLEQELLEVSAVGIPANPEALALALKSGAIEKTDLRELAELLRQTIETSSAKDRSVPETRNVPQNHPNSAIFSLPSSGGEGRGEEAVSPQTPRGSWGENPQAGSNDQTLFASHQADARTDTRALGPGANEAHWLALARALREMMRET